MKIKQSLKKWLPGKVRTATLAITVLVMGQQAALAQPTQVNCADGLAYVTVNREGVNNYLYSMALNASSATLVGSLPATLNGLAYSPVDNFLYAVGTNGEVYRIGANGQYEAVTVSGTFTGFSAGDISAAGVYYIYNNTTRHLVSIDLTVANPAATEVATVSGLNTGENIDDFVFGADGNIYGVTNQRRLFVIDPATGALTIKGTVGGDLANTTTRGTAFMDAAGNLYIGQNNNGILYRIPDPSTGTSWSATSFSTALGTIDGTILDGARCASLVPPSANNDERALTNMDPVNLNIISGNEPGIGKDGAGTYSIDATSVELYDNETGGTVDADGSITIPNRGTFTLNPATGVVTFTPSENFTGEAVIWYTIRDTEGNVSNRASITVTADGTLPVEFDAVSAVFENGQLVVNWTTLTETGNSYFEVEASKDGKTFSKIGTVNSKADAEGNSDSPLSYSFSFDVQNSGSLLGLAIFGIAFVALLFNKKNRWLYTLFIVCGLSIFGASSCAKNDAPGIDASGNLFVRIKQVDKNGSFKYSKTVQAVKK